MVRGVSEEGLVLPVGSSRAAVELAKVALFGTQGRGWNGNACEELSLCQEHFGFGLGQSQLLWCLIGALGFLSALAPERSVVGIAVRSDGGILVDATARVSCQNPFTVHGLKVQLGLVCSLALHLFFFCRVYVLPSVDDFAAYNFLCKRSEGIAGAQAAYRVSPGGG